MELWKNRRGFGEKRSHGKIYKKTSNYSVVAKLKTIFFLVWAVVKMPKKSVYWEFCYSSGRSQIFTTLAYLQTLKKNLKTLKAQPHDKLFIRPFKFSDVGMLKLEGCNANINLKIQTPHVSDKVNFRTKKINRDKKWLYTTTKGSVQSTNGQKM